MEHSYKRRMPIAIMTESEDRLLGMILALASQTAAMRERIDTLETVLAGSGVLTKDAVEAASLTPDDDARQNELRTRLIAKVMQPILDAVEREAMLEGGLR